MARYCDVCGAELKNGNVCGTCGFRNRLFARTSGEEVRRYKRDVAEAQELLNSRAVAPLLSANTLEQGDRICRSCGDNIQKARLMALPYTDICFKCSSKQESEGPNPFIGLYYNSPDVISRLGMLDCAEEALFFEFMESALSEFGSEIGLKDIPWITLLERGLIEYSYREEFGETVTIGWLGIALAREDELLCKMLHALKSCDYDESYIWLYAFFLDKDPVKAKQLLKRTYLGFDAALLPDAALIQTYIFGDVSEGGRLMEEFDRLIRETDGSTGWSTRPFQIAAVYWMSVWRDRNKAKSFLRTAAEKGAEFKHIQGLHRLLFGRNIQETGNI